MKNEAHSRIKINQLLTEAGWRFFDNEQGKANILLENYVKISQSEIDAWGNDFEKTRGGSLDFLLVDSDNKPICVLEAKKESLNPLVGKEQARNYAKSQKVKFIILSRGYKSFGSCITTYSTTCVLRFTGIETKGCKTDQ